MIIDIKDFLIDILKNEIDDDITLHTGRQDDKEAKSIFITNDVQQENSSMFNQTYFKQNISIIIHWSTDYTTTRHKSMEIFNIIKSLKNVLYDDNTLIVRCRMFNDFPTDYPTKTKIYAQEIDFQVQYVTK